MSRTNETRHIEWHKIYKCKCRLDTSICNNKQRWNEGKCRCECNELIGKGMWDKGFKCDKSCDIGEFLDYKKCKCRYKIVDKLLEELVKILMEIKWFIMRF